MAGLTDARAGAEGHRAGERREGRPAALVVAVVAGAVSGVLPVQLMRVQSDSMQPALAAGDVVLVRAGSSVERREVVVVRNPQGSGRLVKRAVAVGGDSVAMSDGVLEVNGTPVCEPGVDPARMDGVHFGPVEVPPGNVYLLGDERDGSVDSRVFGAVPVTEVVGRVLVRAWPSPARVRTRTC